MRIHYFIVVVCFSIIGCAEPGEKDDSADNTRVTNAGLDAVTGNRSEVLVSLPSGLLQSSVQGYLIGAGSERQITELLEGGTTLRIRNIAAGSYDLILSAKGAPTRDNPTGVEFASELPIRVAIGTTTAVSQSSLPLAGKITGTVQSATNNKGLAKITVSVLGTRFATSTNDAGQFVFKSLPPGELDFHIQAEGYHVGYILGYEVLPGGVQQLDPVFLVDKFNHKAGDIVSLSVKEGEPQEDTPTFRLNYSLVAPAGTKFFRMSESKDFEGADWLPFATSGNFKFVGTGDKTLHVEYGDSSRRVLTYSRKNFSLETTGAE